MQRRRIIYAPDARYDRVRLGQWLTRNASSAVARRFDRRIQDAVKKLEYASERGTVRSNRPACYRHLADGQYRVQRNRGRGVHRVLYNGQNWIPDS